MQEMNENLFVVGPAVSGPSFFGREQMLSELEAAIFAGPGARNVVGPTRIGKSSLVDQVFLRNQDLPNRLRVQMSMGSCSDSRDFWLTLASQLEEQIRDAGLWDAAFERNYQKLENADPQGALWWTVLKGQLEKILAEVRKRGYRLVLSIDEFDSVERIFGGESHQYQLLRSMYSEPKFATSGVLISRRRLHLFEAACPYISTFHGVFPEVTVLPFSDEDMEAFYRRLAQCGVSLSSGGRARLERYTGQMPYLCCMFGSLMAARRRELRVYGDQDVDALFRECLPQIDRHYEDLIARLEEDHYLEFIFCLSIGSKCPGITKRDVENMVTMGILIPEQRDGSAAHYHAFSRDFMAYFRLRPLKLPAWETMTASEKKLKSIFREEFPELAGITYQDLIGPEAPILTREVDARYPDLGLNWKLITGYCEDLSSHKERPTVLDVLTLSKVIAVMLDTWDSRFYRYFSGDSGWKPKLEAIRRLRNPLAHAQREYVQEDALAVCLRSCEEIIRLPV